MLFKLLESDDNTTGSVCDCEATACNALITVVNALDAIIIDGDDAEAEANNWLAVGRDKSDKADETEDNRFIDSCRGKKRTTTVTINSIVGACWAHLWRQLLLLL